MKNNRRKDLIIYILFDVIAVISAWLILTFCLFYESNAFFFTQNTKALLLLFISLSTFWLLIYSIFDSYRDLYRQSRLTALTITFFQSMFGCLIVALFWGKLGYTASYSKYFILYFLIHFSHTATLRMALLTRASRRLKQGKVTFQTLIIGGDQNAVELFEEINARKKGLGYHFIGFIDSNGQSKNSLEAYLSMLGKIDSIPEIIEKQNVEEVIIAIETSEHNKINSLLNVLFDYDQRILIKVIPSMYDIMLGTVKMNHVFGAVLIEIHKVMMPFWQKVIKRTIDIVISFILLILLSPVYLYIYFRVKVSSKGPIIFSQERIGLNHKPFQILKFRSMFLDAEADGPQLSNENDDRCTPWGKVMRKWRLDELPQFWNVFIGEMSIVGPRPERKYYIDLITKEAPQYKHLLKVRPGITSWGQVKFGYASNVKQMIQRLKFDILYIENMSLALDFKIMFYTLLVLLQGKGR